MEDTMKIIWAALLGAATIALSGVVAKADTISASLFSVLAPSGSTPTVINLSGITSPSQSPVIGSGYSINFSGGNEGIVQGSVSGSYAVPVAGEIGTTPEFLTGGFGAGLTTNIAASGNYLSTGIGTVRITFTTPQTSLALLWGSIDSGNSLTFNDTAGSVITGTEVQTVAAGFVSNGFQGPGGSAYIVVDTSTPFTTVSATSSSVSFEFAGVAAATTPFTVGMPEPASLMLFGSGIGLIATCMFCRRRQI
jgi:PEP-CTERM motif